MYVVIELLFIDIFILTNKMKNYSITYFNTFFLFNLVIIYNTQIVSLVNFDTFDKKLDTNSDQTNNDDLNKELILKLNEYSMKKILKKHNNYGYGIKLEPLFSISVKDASSYSEISDIDYKSFNKKSVLRSSLSNSYNSKTKTELYKANYKEIFTRNTSNNLSFQKVLCSNKQCKFCCLSNIEVCGNEFQCMKVNDFMRYNNILFYLLLFIVSFLMVVKLCSSQGLPPNDENEKLDDKTLNIYYNLFIHNETNRRKFKL